MGGIMRGHAIDDALRFGWPVRCGERETVIGARIERIQFDGYRVHPRATNAELRRTHANKPIH